MDLVRLLTLKGVNTKILIRLNDLELQQVACVNWRLHNYMNSIGIWDDMWKLLIDQPHPKCTMHVLRATWMINRGIYEVAKFSRAGMLILSPPDRDHLKPHVSKSSNIFYHYIRLHGGITYGDITKTGFFANIKNTWYDVMHLLSTKRRNMFILNTPLSVLACLPLRSEKDNWELIRIYMDPQIRKGFHYDPEVHTVHLIGVIETLKGDKGITGASEYFQGILDFKLGDFIKPGNISVSLREYALENAMRRGWTARAWLRKNYIDMSTHLLSIIWRVNRAELISHFNSLLSIRMAPRLAGMCVKMIRLDGVEELQYTLLRYLIALPSGNYERKIRDIILYLRSVINLRTIEQLRQEYSISGNMSARALLL